MTITVDFGILAFVLSIACIAAVIYHIRSEDRRFKAMLEYIDKCDEKRRADLTQMLRNEIDHVYLAISADKEETDKYLKELSEKVDSGLSDINPNFEAARKAMNQVNDMATGLASLFNYDPVDSLRKQRSDSE